ncbi:MAG: multidrug efflux RND transporter permease subunit [Sporomusaceae bacterium]|nr:multidrug efflux RND transporter permease subunit [Sporomusaceae bacterium]
MAKFFIDRPIFAIVLSIVITLGGLIAAFNLPIAQYPQITPPQVSVSTSYAGANADVIEQTVAQVIEQQVNGVEDMIAMQSTSSDNGSYYSLSVKFQLGKNADIATVQTQNRVAQANAALPTDVQQAGVSTFKASQDRALIFALYSPNGTYDRIFLKNYGSLNFVDDLKRVKGVGEVSEFGSDFAMRIWLLPDKMAQLKVTSADVATAIKQQNIQAPAGIVGQLPSNPNQEHQYSLRAKGRLSDPEEFARIVVRSQSDGSFIRIGDVAKVELGARDYGFFSDTDGQPTAGFSVQLSPDANALETVANCIAVIEEAAKRFPNDMKYKVVFDSANYVRESMKEVAWTFAEAIALVLLVVFIFLKSWRATLIPMLAVPVSLIGTFGAFLLLGFSINTLTLFAMVLAIGLVVDDAIVVIEAVEHHMRYNGLSPHDATVKAMSEVQGPVVAIAFVLASVFIPVAFLGGTMGVLYKQFALTVAVSMGLSAIVALSLTPALCALLLEPYNPNAHGGKIGMVLEKFNDWFDRMVERYGGFLAKLFPRARLAIVLLVVLLILTGALFRVLPSSFVPDEDQGFVITSVSLPEASNMNRTREILNKVAANIDGQPGVDTTMAVTGFDLLSGGRKPNVGVIFTKLDNWDERPSKQLSVSSQIQQIFMNNAAIPEATILAFAPPALPGIGTTGGFTMMIEDRAGTTLDEMDKVSKEFVAAARKRPEIGMIYSSFSSNTPGFEFEVDREKALKLGVPVSDVFSALQAYFGGSQVNDFNRFGRSYKVVMQAEPQFRSDVDALRFFYVRSSNGTMVPLNNLLKPKPVNAPSLIKRFNSYRAIQIGGNPAPGYSSGQALVALEQVAKETLPTGFAFEWADQSREEKISGSKAPLMFALSILFVFLCLAALYESWTVPFAVLLCVPTGVFGAFFFQYGRHLFNDHINNNIYMQIALIMLIGLASKNAILIVEFAKVRVDKGMAFIPAAIEAAKIRLRPIVMTSLAFIIGCIPLAIASGAGAGARNAMGTAVVGGMFAATAFGIFLIPVLFVIVERGAQKLAEFKRRRRESKAAARDL